jgi:hypothetical protein
MKKTSENTEGAIKNGQSRETGKIGYTQRRKMKQKHNNYKSWTPLYTNKRFYVKHFTDSGFLKKNMEGVRRGHD